MYFIGLVIVVLGVIACFVMKGVSFELLMHASPSAIVIIITTLIGVLTATSNFRTFICGCKAIFSSKYKITDSERVKSADLFRLLSKSTILAALIAALAGVLVTLQHLDNPELMALALASSVRVLIVGLLVSLAIFEPASFLIRKR